MKSTYLALGALCLSSLPLSAVTLVGYNFDANATAVTDSAPGVVTAPLVLTIPGNTGFVRTTTGPENGAGSLAIQFQFIEDGPAPTGGAAASDNIVFSVSTTGGQFLQLESLTFLTALNSDQQVGAVYSVQYNLGAGYVDIGSSFTQLANDGQTRTIDLSDPIFSSVSSISFRINVTEPIVPPADPPNPTNPGNASARIDDISLNGSVIPEPSSFAILAAAGLLAIGRRCRR